MIIDDKPNLERTKNALIAYQVYLAQHSLRADEKRCKEFYEPEIKATDELLKAVEFNLKKMQEHDISPAFATTFAKATAVEEASAGEAR